MQLKISTHIVVSAAFAITTAIVFFFFSQLFNEIIIFYLGITFALSIFFFSLTLFRRDASNWSFKIANVQITEFLLYTLTISSVIIVLIVSAHEGSMLEWMSISPLNWLRYLSYILLTSFLPGYFLLKIFDRRQVITGSIVIVSSYLLSLFITFLAGFFILLSANPLEVLGLQTMLVINIALIIIHYFTNREKPRIYSLTIDWAKFGLILSILAVVTVGSIILMINNMPLTSGDMQRHYGNALEFSKGFPVYEGHIVTYLGGYLFSIYLGVLFALSGIPPALAAQGLYLLSFMPLLAFYSSIKAWFSENLDKRLPLIATMLSFLLGFGGLYALYLTFADYPYSTITQLLSTTTSKTCDVYMRILYLPDIVAPLWNIGLPVFFTLLYLLKTKRSTLINTGIISILVALGYLAHASEIFFFVFILFIYVLFVRRRNEEKIGPYIVLGLAVVAIVDFVAPAQVYVLSDGGTVLSLPFVSSLIIAALTSFAELVKDRCVSLFSIELRKSLLEKLVKGWRYGKWILIYIYVFFFVFWLIMLKDFNLWGWGGFTFTPFFVLPVRLGAVGLIAIISIAIYFSKIIKNRTLLFFLLLIPLGFILEQTANYYSLYPAYRFGTITFVGACVTAAYGIMIGIDKIRSTKLKLITSVFLGFLILTGMLSTALFYVNASYYSENRQISQDDLAALDYIRQNTPANASVFTLTTESANNLRNLAGLNVVQDAQRWSNLLSTSNPYIITYILGSSNIKYIYVTQKDAELLSNIQLNSFLKYFSKVFQNGYATVYEVPPLTAPSPETSFRVMHFSPSIQKIANSTWIEDSFIDRWCPYSQYGEIKNYELKAENGIITLSVTSNQSGNIWASYALPLELKTKDSVLSFRYKVDNDYTWFTIVLQNATRHFSFYRGHLTDRVFTTKSYPLPDGQDITIVEIIVETTDKSPPQTSAVAQIGSIEISQEPFSKDDILPSLFTSLLHSPYTVDYIDDLSMKNIDTYLSNYTHIILPSDPQFHVESLLEWVSAGNTLIVFNTYGNGFFANLLGITHSSPTLSINNINSGKILYINSFPKIAIGEESDMLQPNFLNEVKALLTIDEYVQKIDTLPVYNSIFGGIQIQGDLEVNTNILILQGAINLPNSPFSVNESTAIKIYGNITLTIKNATLSISPSESYMLIKPDNYPIEGEILVNSSEQALILADRTVIYNSNTSITFKFTSTAISVQARLPAIDASGTTTFDELDVHAALYVPLAGIVQQKAEIQGIVEFDTIWISNSITMFSMFHAEGAILNLAETISRPIISWIEVLTSPYNLTFTAIFMLGIATYVIIKRKAKL
jgi:hypothetical protein